MTRRDFLARIGDVSLSGLAAGALVPHASGAQAPGFQPDVELAIGASPASRQLRTGRATDVWSYTADLVRGPRGTVQPVQDSYLGPTIHLRTGQKVRARFTNQLPEPTIVHWHGLHVPDAMDGHPRQVIGRGATFTYEFEVVNRPGTYWYHPHHHDRTGPQVYRGLAGALVVTSAEEDALELPSGDQDLVCVIQDRTFDRNNQLVYLAGMPMDRMTGFLGDEILVNGRPRATFGLATRAYRLRLLNGSNSRIYKLAWDDAAPMTTIATDGGLLEAPMKKPFVTLAPGERVDAILDLSDRAVGSTLILRSLPFSGTGSGMGMGMGRMSGRAGGVPNGAPLTVLTVRVDRRERAPFRLPSRLSTFDGSWQPSEMAQKPTRSFAVNMRMMSWELNGRTFEMTGIAPNETIRLGSKEVWELVNESAGMMRMAHPIHLHGRQFRVLRRDIDQGSRSDWQTLAGGFTDEGWKDTVLMMPGERVQILVHALRYPGLFLYHCHNLEHEDLGMMRNYRVV